MKPLFREKALQKIKSPEQLTDYLRVMNPGVWVILLIVLLILGSLVAWSSIGTLETKVNVKVDVSGHVAQVISTDGTALSAGLSLSVSGQEVSLASAREDEYGRSVGVAELALPDGTYDGTVVTETVHPFDFLIESR